MSTYEKFRPQITPLHEPFWDSVRAHAMAMQRCDRCGAFRFIPAEICPKCHSGDATWTPVSGRGHVYTFTVVHRAPTPAYQADAPYVIVHVQTEEGPRVMSHLVGVAVDDVRIGMPVKVRYDDVADDLTLYLYEPA